MNLMVRSAQEVDWYTNIHTGHNILILKKKKWLHSNPLVPQVLNLQLVLYSSITLSTLTPRSECQVKVSLFRCLFTPIHTIHTYHNKRNGFPLNCYEVHFLTIWVQQLSVQVEMHISTAPYVNRLTCSKLFFRSRCVVPTFTASLTILHCTEVVLVTTTTPIVEWCTAHMIWIIVPSFRVVVAFPRCSRQ